MSVSRWYNNTGPAAPASTAPAVAGGNNLDQTLGTGASLAQSAITIGAGIAAVRQQSGAAAARQQRIAACGRKPLVGVGRRFRERKEKYRACVAALNNPQLPIDKGLPSGGAFSSQAATNDRTMIYVGVGVGILVLGTIAYFAFKK